MSKQPTPEAPEKKVREKVSATSKFLKDAGYAEIEVDFHFPETLDEMAETFGEEITRTNAEANMVVALQGSIRRWAESQLKGSDGNFDESKTLNVDKIQEQASAWKPGIVQRSKKSKVEKVLDITKGMSSEDLAAFIKAVQEQAAQG